MNYNIKVHSNTWHMASAQGLVARINWKLSLVISDIKDFNDTSVNSSLPQKRICCIKPKLRMQRMLKYGTQQQLLNINTNLQLKIVALLIQGNLKMQSNIKLTK